MTKKKLKKIGLISLCSVIALFILINISIIIQAYSISHFKESATIARSYDSEPNFLEAVKMAVCGMDVPRAHTKHYPTQHYDSLYIPINNNMQLEAWILRTDSVKKGLIIGFHGYTDEMSFFLDRTDFFMQQGYDVLLVNFIGAGNSSGNNTTIGYAEAENVKDVYNYASKQMHEENIILTGFSMGAVAVMKAQCDYNFQTKAIIIEAPYGTLQSTINARVELLHLPRFPVGNLFTFWFGKIHGFDAFSLNPQDYAKKITVPSLLMCGGKDQYIPESETQTIFDHLASTKKQVKIFPESPHQSYLVKYPDEWKATITHFLGSIEK